MDYDKHFYKENESDVIWWVDDPDEIGVHLFSFDRKTVFNLFEDYPYRLTPEQIETFDRECPQWAEFFKDRKEALT